MYRLLHALASTGVLEEKADACFSLTDIGECLRSDSPHSRAAWARNTDRAYVWNSWGALRHSVMTGEDAFRYLHGAGVWDWRAERPEEAAIFDASMAEMSRGVADAIGEALDFSGFECIVDIGGGRGVLLAGLLKRNRESRGILYDCLMLSLVHRPCCGPRCRGSLRDCRRGHVQVGSSGWGCLCHQVGVD